MRCLCTSQIREKQACEIENDEEQVAEQSRDCVDECRAVGTVPHITQLSLLQDTHCIQWTSV